MPLSSILCSWIQLTETNKTWNFEENRLRKLNDSLPSKTMIVSSPFSSSRLISSSKTMVVRAVYHYSYEIVFFLLLIVTLHFHHLIFHVLSNHSDLKQRHFCLLEAHSASQLFFFAERQCRRQQNHLHLHIHQIFQLLHLSSKIVLFI